MSARVTLRTRRFELSAEAADTAELDKIFDLLKARGIEPWVFRAPNSAGGASGSHAQSASAMNVSTSFGGVDEVTSTVESSLDSFVDEDETLPAPNGPMNLADPTLDVLAWDERSQVYTLSSKLTPGPNGAERADEAAIVILNGYSAGRGLQSVTGSRLVKSLRLTGYNVPRVDTTLRDFENTGLILVSGVRRGREYQITGSGKDRARKIALELIAQRGNTRGSAA